MEQTTFNKKELIQELSFFNHDIYWFTVFKPTKNGERQPGVIHETFCNKNDVVRLSEKYNKQGIICIATNPRPEWKKNKDDVKAVKTLFIDLDVPKNKKIDYVSSESDHKNIIEVATGKVVPFLENELNFEVGFVADSGNGCHILCKMDIPVDTKEKFDTFQARCDALKKTLENKFGSDIIDIDNITKDVNRRIKLVGTINKKDTEQAIDRIAQQLYVKENTNIDSNTKAFMNIKPIKQQHTLNKIHNNSIKKVSETITQNNENISLHALKKISEKHEFKKWNKKLSNSENRSKTEFGYVIALIEHGLHDYIDVNNYMTNFTSSKWANSKTQYRETTFEKAFDTADTSRGSIKDFPEINNILKININYEIIRENVRAWYKKDSNALIYETETKKYYQYNPELYTYQEIDEEQISIIIDNEWDTKRSLNPNVRRAYQDSFFYEAFAFGKKIFKTALIEDQQESRYKVQYNSKIYNYKTNEIKKATKYDFNRTALRYDLSKSDIETPNIDRILKEWVGDNYLVLKSICAYSLINFNPHKLIFFYHGKKDSGKSMFTNFLRLLVGLDNYHECNYSKIAETKQSKFELQHLINKLICICSEIDQSKLYDTQNIKSLSGNNDSFSAEFKGRNKQQKFQFNGNLHIPTNDVPRIKKEDKAFMERCVIIDFPNKFGTTSKDLFSNISKKEYENFMLYCHNEIKDIHADKTLDIFGTHKQRYNNYLEKTSLILGFIRKYIDIDTRKKAKGEKSIYSIDTEDLYQAIFSYYNSKDAGRIDKRSIGIQLQSHIPGLIKSRHRDGANRTHTYLGIKWNELAYKELDIAEDSVFDDPNNILNLFKAHIERFGIDKSKTISDKTLHNIFGDTWNQAQCSLLSSGFIGHYKPGEYLINLY